MRENARDFSAELPGGKYAHEIFDLNRKKEVSSGLLIVRIYLLWTMFEKHYVADYLIDQVIIYFQENY